MPDNTLDAGKEITAEQAKKYVEAYNSIRDDLQKNLIEPSARSGKINPLSDDAQIFYECDINSFLFSKELIMSVFEKTPLGEEADHLLIQFAAKYEDKDKGKPTVVAAGVIKKGAVDEYYSLKKEFSALEQPPGSTKLSFPPTQGDEPQLIKFTFTPLR